MSELPTGSHGPRRYEIHVKGHLDSRWGRWFGELDLSLHADGTTVIDGALDQAALHGLLRKLRDTGLPLISLNQVPPGDSGATERHEGTDSQ